MKRIILFVILLASLSLAACRPATIEPIETSAPSLTPVPPTKTPLPPPTLKPTPEPTPTSEILLMPQLQLNLAGGDSYLVHMNIRQLIKQNLQGQEIVIDQFLAFSYSYTVLTDQDQDGNYWVEMAYDRIVLEATVPGSFYSYDSDNPTSEIPPQAQGFSALIGKKFSAQISSSGEVLAIQGMDEILEQMLAEIKIDDPASKAQMAEQFRRQYNDEAMEREMKNLVITYPDHPLYIGDQWSESTQSSGLTPLLMDVTYTLEEFDGRFATLDIVSTLESDPDAPPMDMGGVLATYELTGTQSGKMVVDSTTGLLVNSVITQDVSGYLEIQVNNEQLSVPLSWTGEVTITFTKVK